MWISTESANDAGTTAREDEDENDLENDNKNEMTPPIRRSPNADEDEDVWLALAHFPPDASFELFLSSPPYQPRPAHRRRNINHSTSESPALSLSLA